MSTREHVVDMPLAAIAPHPHNERVLSEDDEAMQELVGQVRARGVLEPIVVAPVHPDWRWQPPAGIGHVIVFGHRRWFASRLAEQESVPAIVRELTWEQVFLDQVAENAVREDLSPMQEARKVARLLAPVDKGGYGLSQRAAAEKVTKSQSWVAKRLKLVSLPADVQTQVETGEIKVASAYELTKLAAWPDKIRDVIVEARGLDEVGFRDAVDRTLVDVAPQQGEDRSRGGRPRAERPTESEADTTQLPARRERRTKTALVPIAERAEVRTLTILTGADYAFLRERLGPRVRGWVSQAVTLAIEEMRQEAALAEVNGRARERAPQD